MPQFEQSFTALTRTKKGEWAKLTPKLTEKLLQLITETPYKEVASSSLGSPSFLSDLLWKNYSQHATDSHVLILAAALSACGSQGPSLTLGTQESLESLLTRLVQIYERKATTQQQKLIIVRTFKTLVEHPDIPSVRRCLSPMFSILSWSELEYRPVDDGLDDDYLNAMAKLKELPPREQIGKIKLSSVVSLLCTDAISYGSKEASEFMIVTLEFLYLILSQLPTRRFVKTVIDQANLVFVLQNRPLHDSLKPYVEQLHSFIMFPVDEFSAEMIEPDQLNKDHTTRETLLQSTLYSDFKDKVGEFLLSNISLSSDLELTKKELSKLESQDLDHLLHTLRISKRSIKPLTEEEELDLIIRHITPRPDISQIIDSISSLPTEKSLLETYTHQSPLPSLKHQYLSLSDLLLRNYQVLREDTFTSIADHVLTTIPRFKKQKNQTKITGSSRHAVIIDGVKVIKHKSPTSNISPTTYESTIILDLQSSPQVSIPEWNALQTGDVILVGKIGDKSPKSTNAFIKEGLTFIRSSTITTVTKSKKGTKSITLKLELGPELFNKGGDSIEKYADVNVLVKLPPRIKSYRSTLLSISSIIDSKDDILPEWLMESVLGYGDVNAGDWKHFNDGVVDLGLVNIKTLEEALNEVEVVIDTEKHVKKRRGVVPSGDTVETPSDVRSVRLVFEDERVRVVEIDKKTDLTMLTSDQLRGVISSLHQGLTVITGASGTGKRTLVSKMALLNAQNSPSERNLIVTKNLETLQTVLKMVEDSGLSSESVFDLTDPQSDVAKTTLAKSKLNELLIQVDELASSIGDEGAWGNDTNTAHNFYKYHIQPKWETFLLSVKSTKSVSEYPFSKFGSIDLSSSSFEESLKSIIDHYVSISTLFHQLSKLSPLSIVTKPEAQSDYLLSSQAVIIGTTIDQLMKDSKKLQGEGITFDNVLLVEASQMNDFETLLPILYNPKNQVKKITMVGDEKNLGPLVLNAQIGKESGLESSLFERLINRGVKAISLNEQFNRGSEIVEVLKKYYPTLHSHTPEKANSLSFKVVEGELTEHHPGFYQNVLEAEAAVEAVAELLESGVEISDIVMITPYESQKVLLQDVASAKLNVTPDIATVESFRGREKKFSVVSLVHTNAVLEDRKLVAAFSHGVERLIVVCSTGLKDSLSIV